MRASSARWTVLALGWVFLFAGCQPGGGGNDGNSASSEAVGFKFDLPYHLEQVDAGGSALQNAFSASDVFVGTLTATNTDTSEVTNFDWSVYVDEVTLAVQSNKTIVLDPGTYDFALLVHQGDHAYAGEALGVSIVDGTDTIPLTLRPVIGDATTNVNVVARLIDFRFSYDPDEFAEADIVDPRIGILVDGGSEQIFTVDPVTGFSEYMYLNLIPGAHSFALRLYDGAIQRGKSIEEQEHAEISPGVDLTMDLVALQGETTFFLEEEGGDAHFHFVIPKEIVEEAGGTSGLQALLHIVRTESDPDPADEQVLTLVHSGEKYVAEVTIPGFQYETVTISLAFTDIDGDYPLASCHKVVELRPGSQTALCKVKLVRRAVIGGHLLATLGINVFTTDWEPVAGAVVRVNGEIVGITGSGTFCTPGYLRIFLRAGEYTIRADKAAKFGESSVTLAPLDVKNVDVILNQSTRYNASGVQTLVPAANLTGWSKCFKEKYSHNGSSLGGILAACNKPNLMLACRVTGSSVLQVLALAPRGDVTFDTGTSNTPHNANGVGWYYNTNYSWGFAPLGAPIHRDHCDKESSSAVQRLCWQTGAPLSSPDTLAKGWRCGGAINLNSADGFERLIYQAD
jgi:hypothetical protein